MSDHTKVDKAVADLLAELDSEFGKKQKRAPGGKEPAHKALNKAFHGSNPQVSYAKNQLLQMKFENRYDWELHLERMHDIEKAQAEVPELVWLPEAQVSFIIHQQCASCAKVTSFIGNEYIRFRGRRRTYRTLEGKVQETYPTMLKRVSEVDGNLLAFGLPNGEPLEHHVEEINETVPRCPECIWLERASQDLWISITKQPDQGELDIDIPLTASGT